MKIIFFARDPGAANILKALDNGIEGDKIIFAKDYARKIFASASHEYHDFNQEVVNQDLFPRDSNLVTDWLKKIRNEISDDIIIITGTTHFDDYTDRLIWECAASFKMKTLAVLDQWYRLEERFVTPYGIFRPDFVLTPSEEIATVVDKKNLAKQKAVFIGHPYLETLRKQAQFNLNNRELVRANIKKMFRQDFHTLILLASEPQSQLAASGVQYKNVDYTQFELFDNVVKGLALSNLNDQLLLVKPHPKESLSAWNQKSAFLINDEVSLYDLIAASDIVIGTKSMLLLEAVIFGKVVISLDFWGILEERLITHDLKLSMEVRDINQLKEAFDRSHVNAIVDRESSLKKMGLMINWQERVNNLLFSL
jgi:hypothetical protein